jgi:CHAD domain-containing protein
LTGDETTLGAIFHREAKRMRRTFEALGEHPADDVLHSSRIAVKRARYAADLAAPELGRRGERFVQIAKQMQDVLGDHQDAVFAEERIRTWVASDPAGAFAAGRLVQLERDRKAAARAAWPAVWRQLDAAARRAVP